MQAVILAGGFGTRLRSLVSDKPKSMAVIKDKPFIEYQIKYLQNQGIRDLVLCVGYKHEQIIDYFKDGSSISMKIEYSIEKEPLGTGGAIKNALDLLQDDFLVMNGDTIVNIQYSDIYEFHNFRKADVTMVLVKVHDNSRYGSVAIDDNNNIISFMEKNISSNISLVNAGIYIMKKNSINWNDLPKVFSLEKDLFPKLVSSKTFVGYKCESFFIDIGIPKDLKRLESEIASFRWLFNKDFKT